MPIMTPINTVVFIFAISEIFFNIPPGFSVNKYTKKMTPVIIDIIKIVLIFPNALAVILKTVEHTKKGSATTDKILTFIIHTKKVNLSSLQAGVIYDR